MGAARCRPWYREPELLSLAPSLKRWQASTVRAEVDSTPEPGMWHCITRGYFDLPSINGTPLTSPLASQLQRELPIWFKIEPRTPNAN